MSDMQTSSFSPSPWVQAALGAAILLTLSSCGPETKPETPDPKGAVEQTPKKPSTKQAPTKAPSAGAQTPGTTERDQGDQPGAPKGQGKLHDFDEDPERAKRERAVIQKWITPPSIDLKKQRVGELVSAEFKLHNPTSKDHVIENISSSCKCQSLRFTVGEKVYECGTGRREAIPVPAGARGTVLVKVRVPDEKKRIVNEIRIETSDPTLRALRFGVFVRPYREFTIKTGGVVKRAIDYGELAESDVRKFEFRVRAHDDLPFEIKRHDKLPWATKLSFAPLQGDKREWKIEGQIGPQLQRTGLSALVNFVTDRDEGFSIHVYAKIRPTVRLDPGPALIFGRHDGKSPVTRTLKLTPSDSKRSLGVARVEILDPPPQTRQPSGEAKFKITNAKKPGEMSTVELTIPPQPQKGNYVLRMLVHFEGKGVDPIEIRAFGLVR